MVDVTDRNFRSWYPEIEQAIAESVFVAIDFEFLGIPTVDDTVSLFDSSDERYIKNVEAVRKFPPCQMGLACFRESEMGDSYEVEVFSLAIFKRMSKKVFSFSLPAMKFLAKHKFDFNKFIADGVTYANRSELLKLKKDIIAGDFDYDIFCDGLDHRLQMLKLRILEEARDTFQDSSSEEVTSRYSIRHSESATGPLHLYRPILIELVSSRRSECVETVEASEPLWDRDLTAIEAAAIVYVLSEEHPNCDFQLDHTRTLLYCAEQPLMFRAMKDHSKKRKVLLKNLLNEVTGAAQIVNLLSEKKLPIIAHNSFLDMMYLYHYFEGDLPDCYEKFKKCLHASFPTVIDTKTLAGTVQEKLREHGVTDLSLQTLGNYFDSPSCGQILPFRTPDITGGTHSQAVFTEGEHYHNAAFDALMTGEILIKLAYLYAFERSAGRADFSTPWPLRKLLFACRAQVANKLPIPLIDSLHCNLIGDDPVGNRPDLFEIEWKLTPPSWLAENYRMGKIGKTIVWLMDRFGSKKKLISAEVQEYRSDIRARFGAHRVDVKRTEDGMRLIVATNSANTFVKVCSWICTQGDFRLPSELQKRTYEERLIGARMKKKKRDKTRERQWEEKSTGRILTLLSLAATMAIFLFGAKKLIQSG